MQTRRVAEELAIVKHLLVVARHRRQLYEEIKRAFAGHESVDVILDRRVLERRQSKEAPGWTGAAATGARAPASTSSCGPSAGRSCSSISPSPSAAESVPGPREAGLLPMG